MVREGVLCATALQLPARMHDGRRASDPRACTTSPGSAVEETEDHFAVALRSDDGVTSMSVRGRRTESWPVTSVCRSLEEASAFFQAGSLGYSATRDPSRYQGLELRCVNWAVEPLEVEEVRSSFFEDESLFPRGSIDFDCALLIRGIEHEWHGRDDLCCASGDTNRQAVPLTGATVSSSR